MWTIFMRENLLFSVVDNCRLTVYLFNSFKNKNHLNLIISKKYINFCIIWIFNIKFSLKYDSNPTPSLGVKLYPVIFDMIQTFEFTIYMKIYQKTRKKLKQSKQ